MRYDKAVFVWKKPCFHGNHEKQTAGAKARVLFVALTAVRVKTLTYQLCPE
jgi:hypothetical protein